MDNILDRFGLYDFFGLLIPGMYFIFVMDLLEILQMFKFEYPTNEAIMVVMFVLFGYVIGTLMQEIGSLLDRKLMHMRKKAMTEYLNKNVKMSKIDNFFYDTESCFTELELETIKKLINVEQRCNVDDLLKEEISEKCKNAFFDFKSYLEINGGMSKANKLDALFAMSRDLIVCNLVIGICTVIYWKEIQIFKPIHILWYIIVSSFVLGERAQRYANMRVRAIIRRYIMLKREGNTSVSNTTKENTSEEGNT